MHNVLATPRDLKSLGSAARPAALEIRDVTKSFGNVPALRQLDLTVQQGEVMALLGPSGCGKTTALRIIAGFETPNRGTVALGERIVFDAIRNVPPEKRQVGMVFQEGALFPHLSVEQNVAYGLPRRDWKPERIREVLSMVGLYDLRHRMPHELSGGQQQRVSLARALAPRPQLLLLDEPFSNLDPQLRDQVRRDVLEIIRSNNVTAIFVTHDQEEALFVGDTIVVMNQGVIEQVDTPEAIFHQPQTRFVAEFIGTVDFLSVWRKDNQLLTAIGPVGSASEWPADVVLEAMARPDCLECYPCPEGPGVIVGREFKGAFYLYRIAFPSGEQVRCLSFHTAEHEIGAPVAVTLRSGHSLRLFANGRALPG